MAFNYTPAELLDALQDLIEDSPIGDLLDIIGDILPPPPGDGFFNVAQATLGEDGTLQATGSTGGPLDAVFAEISGGAGQQQQVIIPDEILQTASLYSFTSDADLSIGFNTVERTIISGSGNDLITAAGNKNTTLVGGLGNDTLVTSGGNDSVVGGPGNDSLSTGAGDDTILTGLGHDTINAGEGFDVVQFNGDIGNFNLFGIEGDELFVHNKLHPTNSATLSDVEFLSFTTPDGNEESIVIVDNETDASAMRLYNALFDRDADVEGAQYWLEQLEAGAVSLTDVVNSFLSSEEFQETNGSLDNEAFVELLYNNALDRPSDEAGAEFWIAQLENGASQAQVLIGIVGSAEAADTIDNVHIIPGNQV